MDEYIDNELDDSIFQDVLELNASIASNVFLEDSTLDSSMGSLAGVSGELSTPVGQSTPRKPQPAKRQQIAPVPPASVIPSAPAQERPERIKCNQCANTYANDRTLAVHLRMHAMKNVSSRTPTETKMRAITKESLLKSCKEAREEKCQRGSGIALSEYCAVLQEYIEKGEGDALVHLFSECFFEILRGNNVLLPSALRNIVYRATNKKLNSKDFRKKVKEVLETIKDTSPAILNLFVGCVGFKVFTWQLVFVLNEFRGQSPDDANKKFSSDHLHPEQFRQLVFHIAGAFLKGILKKAQLYCNNPDWCRLGDITKRKFISEPFVHSSNDCSSSVTSFTEGRDRGGLTYFNQEAFDFFMQLFNLIMSVEGADGSLPLEKVESVVLLNDVLIFTWDDIVGVDLTEDQSMQLFSDVVRCCVKVVAKGILKRKLNEQLLKAYSSVALRKRVARSDGIAMV